MGEYLKLSEVCRKESSNIAMKDLENRSGEYEIYGASGLIKKVDFYQQERPYIAIVKDGAGVGRVMKLPAKSSVIGTMQYIIPNEGIDVNFLAYALEHLNLAKYNTGATIPHIYFKDYCGETIPAYSSNEQKQIAGVLDRISGLISLRKQQLTKLDELVKSRFIELFGDPVNNPNRLPTKPLAELGSLDRGRSKHRPRNDPKLLGGPYPLIQTGEVSNAGLYITEYQNTYSELGLKQSKMWSAGTLCITIAANIAQTAILTFDACFPDSVVGFIPSDEIDAIYMHYWFSFFQKILDEQAPQVAQKNINLKILSELQVTIPSKEEQKEFVAFVIQTDKSKLAIQKSLEKLETLKKALMQKHFG